MYSEISILQGKIPSTNSESRSCVLTKQISLICQVRQELQQWKSKPLIYLSALTHKVTQPSVQK